MERDSKGRFLKGCKYTEEEKLQRHLNQVGKDNHFLGKHHTEESKLKNSLAHLGHKPSEETKKKLSIARQGRTPMLGKKHSLETINKMCQTRKGKIISEETKLKISIANKGNKHTEESKLKMSLAKKGQEAWNKGKVGLNSGDKNPAWKGGVTPEYLKLRMNNKSIQWRKAIFERDNYTCQKCNISGGKLNAHHVKSFTYYPELRFELSNGITYCKDCHQNSGLHKKVKLTA